VLILNLNPCYDNWVILDRPQTTTNVERGDRVLEFVDGKGLNIGRVLKGLGYNDFTTLNIVGGLTGEIIEQSSRREGLPFDLFKIEGRSRINTAVVYAWKGDMKVINQPGPDMSPREISGFLERFAEIAAAGPQDIVLSGSTPNTFTPDHLAELVDIALRCGCRIKADIGPKWLRAIGRKGLSVIKVNNEEFQQSFCFDITERHQTRFFMQETGTGLIVITYGKQGAIACDGERFVRATLLRTESNIAVGSGDSFFAGLLLGQATGQSLEECLKTASACGYANTLEYGPGFFTRDHYTHALAQIRIEEM